MISAKKAVYFLCINSDIDPMAGHVFDALSEIYKLVETQVTVDGYPVLKHLDDKRNEFYFVRTDKVVCHDYGRYLPIMNRHFSDFDMAGLVTWHEGQNAPDKILSVHTTGDVETGYFGNADPVYIHNLLLSLEKNRIAAGLEDFRITTEGTHWSGIVNNGGTPDMILQFSVPLVDIEIGSTQSSWSNPLASKVIAHALIDFFNGTGKKLKNLLCVGGVHFEPAFAAAVLQTWEDNAFGISHILPNHWLVSGHYELEDGLVKLENCIKSIKGGIDGIVFHDNLKGAYKEQLRLLGKKYNVPVFKHQLLRRPLEIQWNR